MAENHQAAHFGAAAARRRFWAPLSLLLIVICGYWKITLTRGEYTWLDSPDLASQVMPWIQFEAREIHRGTLPLWDPHEWGGQSLIGQAQPAVANPVNWLMLAMPLDDTGHIQEIYLDAWFVFIRWIAALCCYFLCLDLGRSVSASVFGATAFSLGGWIGYVDWPQMTCGGIAAPLVFLFFFRALRGERPVRNAAISGAMLGLCFLSGHHQIPIFIGLAIGGAWIYYIWKSGRQAGTLLALAAFGVMFGLMGALQILPASDYGSRAVRWVGANNPAGWHDIVPYRVLESLSFAPVSVAGLVVRNFTSDPVTYIGWTILLMGAAGLAVSWREPPVRILAAVAAGGMLFAMGPSTVFHGIVYSLVPNVDKARNIAFAAFLFSFGVAPLSAFGIDRFLEAGRRFRSIAFLIAASAGFLCIAAPWILFQTKLTKSLDYDMVVFSGICALLLAGLLAAWTAGGLKRPATLLTLLALSELGASVGYGYQDHEKPASFVKKLRSDAALAARIQHLPGPVRLEMDDEAVPYNFADWYGIDVYGGYLASLTSNVEAVRGTYWARMLMGVNYWVGTKASHEHQSELFTEAKDLKVYSNADAFPRVFTVHKAFPIGKSEIHFTYERLGPLLRNQAFFAGSSAPSLESCEGDNVRLLNREANSLEIDADMRCRGLVVAGENYDPGWRATIDGVSAPILETYGVARGIVVPAGHHRIAMRYRPVSIMAGAILTGIGTIALIALLLL